jgi:hypothetical protein
VRGGGAIRSRLPRSAPDTAEVAVDYRPQVRRDIRAFLAGAVCAVIAVIFLVLWRLDVISGATGATWSVAFGGASILIGVYVMLTGPLIYDRAFVVAPSGLGIVPLTVGVGATLSPLFAFAISSAIAVVSTAAFFALRRSRR